MRYGGNLPQGDRDEHLGEDRKRDVVCFVGCCGVNALRYGGGELRQIARKENGDEAG
jgi:hypothetical protein